MYTLRLYHDSLPAGAVADPVDTQHAILYVLKGRPIINGKEVPADTAKYCMDNIRIEAGAEDAVIWRFELIPTDAPKAYLTGRGIDSQLKMLRRVRMFEMAPRQKWLFRLDCIYNNLGSTGLHSHPGSGIRCLLAGNLHVRGTLGEESDNQRQGDTWYEEGCYPVVSTTYGDDPTAFLRAMVLPVEYADYPDTAMWIEGAKVVQSDWKSYSQQIVRLR